jgi:hypothetical protein
MEQDYHQRQTKQETGNHMRLPNMHRNNQIDRKQNSILPAIQHPQNQRRQEPRPTETIHHRPRKRNHFSPSTGTRNNSNAGRK